MLADKLKLFNSFVITSFVSILIVVFTVTSGFDRIISWDTFGQYCYLPSLFIDNTFLVPWSHYEDLNQVHQFSTTLYQFNVVDGIVFTKYTSGLALLLTPFFLLGHLSAFLLGFPMDGYAAPYSIAFGIGCLFYAILGLFALRKVLLHFVSDTIAAWVILGIGLGTNFFTNTFTGGAYTHTLSFLMLCFLLLATIEFHTHPTVRNGIFLGLSLGILGLIRIPDLLFGIIPVFWNISKYGSIAKKITHLFRENRKAVLFALFSFFLIFSLQLVFWKIVSGNFFLDSYANNPGEGFDWFRPHTFDFLFSFKKGWLIYTPLGLLSLWGFVKMWQQKGNLRVLTLSFLIFLYVASSWTTWWYAGSFSQRSMIDVYPIVGISLAILLHTSKFKKSILAIGLLFLILNLFQTFQYKRGVLSASSMTGAYYWETFGQWKIPSPEQRKLLELDYGHFENMPLQQIQLSETLKTWNFPLKNGFLNAENSYTEDLGFSLSDYYNPRKVYLVQVIWKYNPETFTNLAGIIPNATMLYKGKSYGWRGEEGASPNLILDTIKHTVTMTYIVPDLRSSKDILRIQVWRKDPKDIEFKEVTAKLYEIKGKQESEI